MFTLLSQFSEISEELVVVSNLSLLAERSEANSVRSANWRILVTFATFFVNINTVVEYSTTNTTCHFFCQYKEGNKVLRL